MLRIEEKYCDPQTEKELDYLVALGVCDKDYVDSVIASFYGTRLFYQFVKISNTTSQHNYSLLFIH